jgi:hypothetical protein
MLGNSVVYSSRTTTTSKANRRAGAFDFLSAGLRAAISHIRLAIRCESAIIGYLPDMFDARAGGKKEL